MTTYSFQVSVPNRDPQLWHPLLKQRWLALQAAFLGHGVPTMVWEGYRPDARQLWLFGQGRTAEQIAALGLDIAGAQPRPGLIVTNAYSAATSAHGYTDVKCTEDWPNGIPVACALDVVPIGPDLKPWTADDDWTNFVAMTTDQGLLTSYELVHFHAPGKQVWDKPHIQLIEWDDITHTLKL